MRFYVSIWVLCFLLNTCGCSLGYKRTIHVGPLEIVNGDITVSDDNENQLGVELQLSYGTKVIKAPIPKRHDDIITRLELKTGDIITKINNISVTSKNDVVSSLSALKTGELVKVMALRDGCVLEPETIIQEHDIDSTVTSSS